MSRRLSIHGQWRSTGMFLLATTGAVVGIGNLWRFPALVSEHGGGAFLLVYLASLLLFGWPLFAAQLAIGRRTRQNPISALRTLDREGGGSGYWWWVGLAGIIAALLVLAIYSVVAGWLMAYLVRSVAGVFVGATADGLQRLFAELIGDPERLLAWHTLFMIVSMLVVARGVRNGLEPVLRVVVPLSLMLLVLLAAYAARNGQFEGALDLLLTTRYAALGSDAILAAFGHALLTLGLGSGMLIVYGGYLSDHVPIATSALLLVLFDMAIALIAALLVVPLLLQAEMAVEQGPGLVFLTLPMLFGQAPGGALVGTLFFLMLLLFALSSVIALLEPAVTWLVESRGLRRSHAATRVALLVWLLGILVILSFSHWSFQFEFAGQLRNSGMFDVLDIATSSIMLPLTGLAIAIFVGWVLDPTTLTGYPEEGRPLLNRICYLMIRYLAPPVLVAVTVHGLGVV